MSNRREAGRAVAFAMAAALCAQAATAATEAAPAAAPAPLIAARADALLREMSAYLAAAQEFTFTADVTFDHVLPTGQTLQFSAVEEVGVKRPNHVFVDWNGDLGARRFWYDGATLTLFDPATPYFAAAPAPKTIDATLAALEGAFAFTPPLADFLFADPYAALTAGVRHGVYIGVSEVGGRDCHQLAFVDARINWQIWIDAGHQPTPCKIVINYPTRPGDPQFSATFADWDFAPGIAATRFAPDLPPGARQIPFRQEPAPAARP